MEKAFYLLVIKSFIAASPQPIRYAADYVRSLDHNEHGLDDCVATALDYAANLIDAIINQKPLPPAPLELHAKPTEQ